MLRLTRRHHDDKKQIASKGGKRRCNEDTGIVTPTSRRSRKQLKSQSRSRADLKIEEYNGSPPAPPQPSRIQHFLSSPFNNTKVAQGSDSGTDVDESNLYLPTFGLDDSTDNMNYEDEEIRMINFRHQKLKLRPRFGKNPFDCNDQMSQI